MKPLALASAISCFLGLPLAAWSDSVKILIKLHELIRATQGTHNALLDLEELDEAKLDAFRLKYEALA
ncbi:MAG: low affinity iron permease family protein [Methylococcaceae bacterium]|nr:low affinity iron permease family protein [Methylococcaceae bacterium]